MEPDWAAQHLQVIRTLMERSAIYRRALTPMMLLAGGCGLAGALLGTAAGIQTSRAFLGYWLAVGLATLTANLLLLRRHALRDAEPFWSPPARRVARALLPPWLAGCVVTLIACVKLGPDADPEVARAVALAWLPVGWLILYGCALHAAGFFMPRGIRWLGWTFVLGGCALLVAWPHWPDLLPGHLLMGLAFGGPHLAYGLYLHATRQSHPSV